MARTHWHEAKGKDGPVAVRCFPRGGSSSHLNTYGTDIPLNRVRDIPRKVVVVRDPIQRLESAYRMYRQNPEHMSRVWRQPKTCPNLEEFTKWVLSVHDNRRDWHTRTMYGLLMADRVIEDLDDVLLRTLRDFSIYPPYGIGQLRHKHASPSETHGEYFDDLDPELQENYRMEFTQDLIMYETARSGV